MRKSASCRLWEKQQNMVERVSESNTGTNMKKSVSNADWTSHGQSSFRHSLLYKGVFEFLNTWDQKGFYD